MSDPFCLGSYGLGWLVHEIQIVAGRDPAGPWLVGSPFGGLYWLMTVLLPGYVYFRYPAKLLVIAALALSMLAVRGWDRALAGPSPGMRRGLLCLGGLSLLGTLVMPFLFGFGWAKAAPVNFRRLYPRRRGMFLVAAAGPAVNMCLAVCLALLISLNLPLGPSGARTLAFGFYLNTMLALFNLIPMPPLDGSRLMLAIAPEIWSKSVFKHEFVYSLIAFPLLYLGVKSGGFELLLHLIERWTQIPCPWGN